MTTSNQEPSFVEAMNEAIANAIKNSEAIGANLHQFVEQGTETIGKVLQPLAENPVLRFATKVPVLSWLAAALGQVDGAAVQRDVDDLRQKFPLETADQLAQRVILSSTWKAAGIGLITNAIPPLALMLFAVDLGAIAALQAEMIYRIAAIYGFSSTDPTRRGEVLALWGLSTGGSGVLKSGLSIVELLPGLGAVVGVTGDAALLSGMGYLACRFYETKRNQEKQNSAQESPQVSD